MNVLSFVGNDNISCRSR